MTDLNGKDIPAAKEEQATNDPGAAIFARAAESAIPTTFSKHLTGPQRERLDFATTIRQFLETSGDADKPDRDGSAGPA